MYTFNHVITGAVIATAVTQPALALPLAFASHFALDVMPHYGDNPKTDPGGKYFIVSIAADTVLTFAVIAACLAFLPGDHVVVLLSMFLGMSPDLKWAYEYWYYRITGKRKSRGAFARWHSAIQWGERPYFWWIEFAWLGAMALVLKTIG